MADITDLLSANETVLQRTRLSPWVAYGPAIGLGIIGIVFSVILIPTGASVAGIAFVATIAFAGIFAFIGNLRLNHTQFALTDRRVIAKAGVLSSSTIELNLKQVEGVTVAQPLLGRILDFGSVVVTGTGGMKTPFEGVTDPFAFRSAVQSQVELVHRG